MISNPNVIALSSISINKLTKLELLDAHPTQTISIAFRSVTGQLLGLSLYSIQSIVKWRCSRFITSVTTVVCGMNLAQVRRVALKK